MCKTGGFSSIFITPASIIEKSYIKNLRYYNAIYVYIQLLMNSFEISPLRMLLVKPRTCMTTFSTTTLGRCNPLKIEGIFYMKFVDNRWGSTQYRPRDLRFCANSFYNIVKKKNVRTTAHAIKKNYQKSWFHINFDIDTAVLNLIA